MAAAKPVRFNDEKLSVSLTRQADALQVEITDLVTGWTWGPAPLLAMEVHDKTVRREDRLTRYRIDMVERVDNGVHVIVGDSYHSVSVGLWLRLVDGELSVLLSPPEVYERRPAHFRVYAIDLLPGLLSVTGKGGTLLLPVAGGTQCHPADKPRATDRFLIYLEQERWELGSTLPFGAAYDAQGGMMLLARQGAADTRCGVSTDGAGTGQINFAFSLRRYWPDPVDIENREVRLVPMPPKRDPVLFCAQRLRRFVTEDLGKPTLKQRAAESPEIAYLLKGCTMKLFYARENEGLEMASADKSDPVSFVLGMTFAEARRALTRCKEAGIDHVLTQSVGWNARGHDGLYPTRFPVDERLGGESAFRDLIRHGNDALGYHMSVHDNFCMNIAHAPNFDMDVLIHDMFGEPLVAGWWGGGIEYQTWGLALPHERLTGHLERMQGLGIRGLYYCDYMMRPLEVNYHPKWHGPRAHAALGQVRILKEAKRLFGAVATEYGILPAAVVCDYVAAGGGGRKGQAHWPVVGLMDRILPMWELVFSGLTLSEQTGLSWTSAMRAVLLGKHFRDEWTFRAAARQPEMNPARVRALKAMSDLCCVRFGHLKAEPIVAYDEPETGVVSTAFADGTAVTADFTHKRLFVNGKPVKRPAALPA